MRSDTEALLFLRLSEIVRLVNGALGVSCLRPACCEEHRVAILDREHAMEALNHILQPAERFAESLNR